jgi:hypothetical protein
LHSESLEAMRKQTKRWSEKNIPRYLIERTSRELAKKHAAPVRPDMMIAVIVELRSARPNFWNII